MTESDIRLFRAGGKTMKLNKLIAVPAIALTAGIGLAACGSSSGGGSSAGNQAACSAYWTMLQDVNNNDYTDAENTDLPALQATDSGITDSSMASEVNIFTTNMNSGGDASTASAASYVIGGDCTGLGFANPNG